MNTPTFLRHLDKDKLSNIKGGMFTNRSYDGYSSKVLKSGICKYYRRKIFDKFEYCVIEMMLFMTLNKSLLTNLFNRLRILLMEEIIFTELGPICQCIKLLKNIESLDYEIQIKNILKICYIVKICKRGRIVSYINNYNKLNIIKENLDDIVLDNVLKYKKNNDSNILLKYGELFIKYIDIDNDNEKSYIKMGIFNIFQILYENNSIECGIRYRRKDPVYLLFEIIENLYFNTTKGKTISEFVKIMFFRKNMVERRAFGVWYMCFAWKIKNYEFNLNEIDTNNINLEDYFKYRKKLDINEDFVVNDYHVNKNNGIEKFGYVGSVVIEESLDILGENGSKFKQLYIDAKTGKLNKDTEKLKLNTTINNKETKKLQPQKKIKKKKKLKFKVTNNDNKEIEKLQPQEKIKEKKKLKSNENKDDKQIIKKKLNIKFKVNNNDNKDNKDNKKIEKNASFNNYDNNNLKIINFDNFTNIKVLEDGVCGLKVCCIRVDYNGTTYILKEMRKSFNYGKDYMIINELKHLFNIKPLIMDRIKSNKSLTRIDTTKRTLVNNWKFETKEVYYCKMLEFENIGEVGKNTYLLEDDNVFLECLKIRLYDGLFCSSDNILRNILINSDNKLLSIDEGDIYGKRKYIFNKHDWFKKIENKEKTQNKSLVIIDNWNLEAKIDIVSETLIKYGFSDKIDIMRERFKNYKNIVINELI